MYVSQRELRSLHVIRVRIGRVYLVPCGLSFCRLCFTSCRFSFSGHDSRNSGFVRTQRGREREFHMHSLVFPQLNGILVMRTDSFEQRTDKMLGYTVTMEIVF